MKNVYVNIGGKHCTSEGLLVSQFQTFVAGPSDLAAAPDKFVPLDIFKRQRPDDVIKLSEATKRTSLIATPPTMRAPFSERVAELESMNTSQLKGQALAAGIKPGGATKGTLVRAILVAEDYVDAEPQDASEEPETPETPDEGGEQREPAEAGGNGTSNEDADPSEDEGGEDEGGEESDQTIDERRAEFAAMTVDKLTSFAKDNEYDLGEAKRKADIVEALLVAEGWE